jgi:uncharacterized protein (TIGR04255 family)
MGRRRHLNHAPITEAIIDLRIAPPLSFDETQIQPVVAQLRESYPIVERKQGAEAQFNFLKGQRPQAVARDLGYQGTFFKTEDERSIAQFRRDGFTFNRLKPYTSWEQIYPEAMRLWKIYAETMNPEYVTRIALRYINHIEIPVPSQIEDYLSAPPAIPQALPQLMSGFLTRVQIDKPDGRLAATITQASEPGAKEGSITVILDIDAFEMTQLGPRDAGVEQSISLLRDFKNDIFFESLTETALSDFE